MSFDSEEIAVSANYLAMASERRKNLLVGHREDAVPTGGRLVEKIFLTAFPVSARRAVVGPLIENGLKRRLSLEPVALPKQNASFVKTIEADLCVGGKIGRGGDQFVDDDGLQLAFHANE